jgi:carbon monoxide dehydrogenase subunit G
LDGDSAHRSNANGSRFEITEPLMEFDNAFEVPLPVEDAWKVLMDIRRIAPCMPGAELTDVVDDRTYKGKIAVRLGPVALSFAGTVKFDEIDDANHSAKVSAQGNDAKGRGGANAVAGFRLEPAGDGSKVLVHTNLTLSGSVAQYGRGVGIIQMTAAQIITQFANNLKAQLGRKDTASAPVERLAEPASEPLTSSSPSLAEPSAALGATTVSAEPSPALAEPATSSASAAPAKPPDVAPAAAAKPISGLSLAAAVFWQALKRLFGRG